MRYTENTTQFSSAAERRITLRMLSYWERLRGQRDMPKEEDIDPDDLQDLWDSCFLLHVQDLGKTDYNYTYLGENIAKVLHEGADLDSQEVYHATQLQALTKNYHQVVLDRKPLLEEGEFQNMAGHTVKFRQCLLPLGHSGKVLAIMGGVRFKVFG